MELGTYLENGIYLPAISETPWGEQVNNNFIILNSQYESVKINLQEGLNTKLDKESDELQNVSSNAKITGNWEFTNLINGTISNSINSNYSTHSSLADNSNHATQADNATFATNSASSAYAISADTATHAETADNADNANSADFALKAKCDNYGNIINETYLKISDYNANPDVLALNAVTDHIGNTNIHTSSAEKDSINNSLHNLSTGLNTANNNISENTSDIRNLQLALQNINTSGNYVTLENDQTINGTKTFTELINGNITGNATTADKFSSGKTVSLNGDVTGSAISKDTWNITTTLKNTGAVAGSYGLQSNSTVYSGVIKVPYITVNSKGLITNISETEVALPDAGETDVLVEQKYITYNLNYPLLFSSVSDIASTSSRGSQKAGVSNEMYVNPSTNTIYASNFVGEFHGNAETATSSVSATNNANGNELADTIIKGLSISGSTITYTQIDGNTGTITTPNTNTKVTQSISDNDDTYPVLLCPTANATTNQGAKTSIFASDVKVNPSTGKITATSITVDSINAVDFYQNGELITDFGGNGNVSANDATLTIQQNGTTVDTFTANASSDKTINITVPTKTSELTNDSGFITGSYLPLSGGTLTGDLKFKITGYERGNNTSSYNIRLSDLYDDNNTRFGLINTEIASDKSSATSIYAYKTTVATGSNIGRIAIGCDSSGKVYTVAPTPATDDNSTKIATTAFVKANMSSVSNRVLTAITSTRTTDGAWTFPCTKHARVYIIGSITADYIPQSEIVVWFYSGCYATGSFIYKATEDDDDVVKNIYITNMASANTITVKIEQHNNATFKSISLVAYQ